MIFAALPKNQIKKIYGVQNQAVSLSEPSLVENPEVA
jgi:hypothetical protein